MKNVNIDLIVGARPNFMKAVPLWKEFKKNRRFRIRLIHTGQHYDETMSKAFFKDLSLPQPDVDLRVGSGTHAEQTARIMIAYEKICLRSKPNLVMVVGDVNSTLAAALVAAKMGIPIAHVEAGLRSFDRTMPEEINRVLTDQISDYLLLTSPEAGQNLLREGRPAESMAFVGNVMIDTLLSHRRLAQKSPILKNLGLKNSTGLSRYALVTLHRPSNVDDAGTLRGILGALQELSRRLPVIFPVHPRTLKKMTAFGLRRFIGYFDERSLKKPRTQPTGKILMMPPVGYLDFLCLLSNAALVLTDSGGIQEETTVLGIPCLTLRANTERPVTVSSGTNQIIGNDPEKIYARAIKALNENRPKKRIPKYWDGKAASRIVKLFTDKYSLG